MLPLLVAAALAAPAPVVRVGPVLVFDGPIWFEDEGDVVAEAIADVLRKEGYDVLPIAEVRAVWAEAREGRRAGTDLSCAPAPPAALAEVRWPDAVDAEARARCEAGACVLTVELVGAIPDDLPALYQGIFVANTTPADWAAAIGRGALVLQPPSIGTMGGGIGGGSGVAVPTVTLDDLQLRGDWKRPFPQAQIEARVAPLFACEATAPPDRDNWGEPVQLAFDAKGHITRCDGAYPHHLPDSALACSCEALATVPFGRGGADRRARFDLRLRTPYVRDAWTRFVIPLVRGTTDTTATLSSVHTPRASACLAGLETPIDATVGLSVGVDVTGRPTVIHANDPWPGALDASVQTCLTDAVREIRFDCPASGAATVVVKLQIVVTPAR